MKFEEITCPLGELLLKFTTLEQPCRPTNHLSLLYFGKCCLPVGQLVMKTHYRNRPKAVLYEKLKGG